MKLKRLELLGFKSFCERTVFLFDDGITSIVGPNGCGKSNIVDAILWVLGERGTRTLRVRDMEDVIFHGSDGRKGVGIAEVTLYLSDDSEEYVVRRRIFRDGTNEYFLNGKSVRLKDIQELFLGKGIGVNTYAIIEQGKIESFIHMKPRERKLLIEEAGGITRFKEKKEEALLRLEEVKKNLERVEDVRREVEISFSKAEVEYERWKRFRELSDKKRDLEVRILGKGLEKLDAILGRLNKRSDSLRAELERIEKEKGGLEELQRIKDEEISFTEEALRGLEMSLRTDEKEIESNLRESERLTKRRSELLRNLEELRRKSKVMEERLRETEKEIENARSLCFELEVLMKEKEAKISELNEKAKKEESEILELEEDYEKKRGELFFLASNLSSQKNMILDLERRRTEFEARKRRIKEERSYLESQISKLHEELEGLNVRLSTKIKELETVNFEKEKLERTYSEFSSEVSKLEAIFNFLMKEKGSKEAYLKKLGGIKDKLEKKGKWRRLIDLIHVEKGHERVLQKYFSKELKFYVIESEVECVIRDLPDDENYIFFTDRGLFKKVEEGIGVNFKISSDEDDALRRIKNGEDGIFVCGQSIIDSRGLILKRGYDEGIDLEAEIEKRNLEREIADIEIKLKGVSSELQGKMGEKKRLEDLLNETRNKKERLSVEVEKLKRDIFVTETKLRDLKERLSKLPDMPDPDPELDRIEKLKAELEGWKLRKNSVEGELKILNHRLLERRTNLKRIEETIKEEESKFQKSKAKFDSLQAEIKTRSNYLSLLCEEKESLERELGSVEEEKRIVEEEIKRLYDSYKEKKERVEAFSRKVEELKLNLGVLKGERSEISKKIADLETRRENLRSRMEELERQILLENERRERIVGILKETYSVDPESFDFGSLGIEDLEREKNLIESEIISLGEINFRAEKDYEETLSRLEFLEREKEDLEKAMESLKKTIDRVDSISKEVFSETLSKVSRLYGSFVDKLFGGGEGYLSFDEKTEGVEMYVKPKGKKVTALEMLSGGEKALASASLLFALISANPPPFCLMDEIDAPLDDSNLNSLLEVVKELSRRTQIIFITHNRLTMEASGTIYGITMEEDGVSKVISVKLAR